MSLIIISITGTAIYLADSAIKTAEQKRRYIEFRAEIAEIGGRLIAQHNTVKERCISLAQSVNIMAAMEEGEPAETYRNAAVELREALAPVPGSSFSRAHLFAFKPSRQDHFPTSKNQVSSISVKTMSMRSPKHHILTWSHL